MALNIFLRNDRIHLRRWINGLSGILLPGSAHWASGQRSAAALWFLLIALYRIVILGLSLLPSSSYSPLITHPIEWLGVALYIALLYSSWKCDLPNPKWSLLKFIPLCILISLVLPQGLQRMFFSPIYAPRSAMQPTLHSGNSSTTDLLYINRTAYWFSNPQRGDIILFDTEGMRHPQLKDGKQHLKRIVALPGETIRIVPPHILINEEMLEHPEIFKALSQPSATHLGYQLAIPFPTLQFVLNTSEDRITLKKDEYLVLSDNPASPDSRNWGAIKKENILGKAYYICAPAERKRYLP